MSLPHIDLDETARGLAEPFVMQQVATVDHLALYLYVSLGAVAAHRHQTQDELFYVHSGLLSLETDRGRVDLSPQELVVVPAGLSHVSGSMMRTVVLLGQAAGDPDRRNGQGRVVAEAEAQRLAKVLLQHPPSMPNEPFATVEVARVDDISLRLLRCEGATPWHAHANQAEALLVQQGRLQVGSDQGLLALEEGQLTVVPRGRIHRLAAERPTLVLSLVRGDLTPAAQVGGAT